MSHVLLACYAWAQGPVGVTSGKHIFQVSVTLPGRRFSVGWVDDKISPSVAMLEQAALHSCAI